jgi:hypothetical protein
VVQNDDRKPIVLVGNKSDILESSSMEASDFGLCCLLTSLVICNSVTKNTLLRTRWLDYIACLVTVSSDERCLR